MRYLLKKSGEYCLYFCYNKTKHIGFLSESSDSKDDAVYMQPNHTITGQLLELLLLLLEKAPDHLHPMPPNEIQDYMQLNPNNRKNVSTLVNQLHTKVDDYSVDFKGCIPFSDDGEHIRLIYNIKKKGYYTTVLKRIPDSDDDDFTKSNVVSTTGQSFLPDMDNYIQFFFDLQSSLEQSSYRPEDIKNVTNAYWRIVKTMSQKIDDHAPGSMEKSLEVKTFEQKQSQLFTLIEDIKNRTLVLGEPHEPNSYFLRVDRDFADQCLLDSSEYEKEKLVNYNFVHSVKTTFRMLVNNLLIFPDELQMICTEIYKTAMDYPATFLMSEMGAGKSTILCSIALMAMKDRVDVYYLESDHGDFLPEIKGKTLFLIDDLYDHTAFLSKLYHRYHNDPRVHVLLAEQIYKMNALKDMMENEMYADWISSGRSITLKRSATSPDSTFLSTNNEDIQISDQLVKAISDEIIFYRMKKEGLCADSTVEIDYRKKTITDAVLDYFVTYNSELRNQPVRVKSYIWDWDVWDEDPNLSDLFKYVAALHGCGVKVSTLCFDRMTGRGTALSKAILEGRVPASINSNGFICLRHDSVADNYFAITGVSPYDVLRGLIEKDLLDEDTVIQFVNIVFSRNNLSDPSAKMKQYQIPKLLERFSKSESYRTILSQSHRIHQLEFALIQQSSLSSQDRNVLSRNLGKSFAEIHNIYNNPKELWMKYFLFACKQHLTLSDQLTEFLNSSPDMYKRITNSINYRLNLYDRWISEEEEQCFLSNCEIVFLSIIQNIDSNDVPSRYALSLIYRKQKEYDKARNIVSDLKSIVDTEQDRFKYITNIIDINTEERKHLKKSDIFEERQRIPIIDKTIMTEYTSWLQYYHEKDHYSNYYILLVSGCAGFLMDRNKFGRAYWMLIETINDFTASGHKDLLSRIYCKLGELCQRTKKGNIHYNLFDSAKWFERALETSTNEQTKSVMSILKPLCKTNLSLGNYRKVKALCSDMYQVDKHDREVFSLFLEAERLQSIKDQGLPQGNECDFTWLTKATSEAVTTASNELLDTMTDEQLYYSAMLGFKDNLETYGSPKNVFRILYSIAQNRPVSFYLLKKANIAWNQKSKLAQKILSFR